MQHHIEHGHLNVRAKEFKVLNTGFKNNTVKRRISEPLFNKELKPILNVQEKSIDSFDSWDFFPELFLLLVTTFLELGLAQKTILELGLAQIKL